MIQIDAHEESTMPQLLPGDPFPVVTVTKPGGGSIIVPDAFAGKIISVHLHTTIRRFRNVVSASMSGLSVVKVANSAAIA